MFRPGYRAGEETEPFEQGGRRPGYQRPAAARQARGQATVIDGRAHVVDDVPKKAGAIAVGARIFRDITKEVHRFKPGAEVAPGIVSIPAYGHTPGHTAFSVHSGKQSLLVMSDTVRNPYLFVRHPEWQPIFDMDGPLAAAARRAMLERAAADRMFMEAYHFPFPACGHIVKSGAAYQLEPVMWAPL